MPHKRNLEIPGYSLLLRKLLHEMPTWALASANAMHSGFYQLWLLDALLLQHVFCYALLDALLLKPGILYFFIYGVLE